MSLETSLGVGDFFVIGLYLVSIFALGVYVSSGKVLNLKVVLDILPFELCSQP